MWRIVPDVDGGVAKRWLCSVSTDRPFLTPSASYPSIFLLHSSSSSSLSVPYYSSSYSYTPSASHPSIFFLHSSSPPFSVLLIISSYSYFFPYSPPSPTPPFLHIFSNTNAGASLSVPKRHKIAVTKPHKQPNSRIMELATPWKTTFTTRATGAWSVYSSMRAQYAPSLVAVGT